MSEQAQHPRDLGPLLDDQTLRDWICEQRWYASKGRGLVGVDLVEVAPLGGDLYLTLAQTRTTTGAHEIYQLLLLARGRADAPVQDGLLPIASNENLSIYTALEEDPSWALGLFEKILADADIHTEHGTVAFRHVEDGYHPGAHAHVRAMGAQQSNSSIVIDEQVAMKLFRKLESGINPELEMLRFLTARGFEHIAPLEGWYEYEGSSLASTLGIAQEFVGDGHDGWKLALEQIVSAPDTFLQRLAALGQTTAEMHTVLASDYGDPAFSPEDPINESMSLLTASIDEEIERMFMRLPDTDALAPIHGRGEDVRARLAMRSQITSGGKNIRTHGDLHLGQTLHTPRGWVILDFEGEPGRPLPERRQKRSPLRDVAGMLRSIAYAAYAVEIEHGGACPDGYEQQARDAYLGGYFERVDAALLPAGEAAILNLLGVFELEKALYELRYELGNRPDWVPIPVAGIKRLIEEP